jgi:hypothetical protein
MSGQGCALLSFGLKHLWTGHRNELCVRSASVHLQAGNLRGCVALVRDPKANGRREYRRPSFVSEGVTTLVEQRVARVSK